MKILPICSMIVMFSFNIFTLTYAEPMTNVDEMVKAGREAIEKGEYTKAVDYLGKIMTAVGGQTNDDKIVALGSTVQAYGLWKLNNPQMLQMAKQYLNNAIIRDPDWKFPEKLLKEVENK